MDDRFRLSNSLSLPGLTWDSNRLSSPPAMQANGFTKPHRPPRPPMVPHRLVKPKPRANGTRGVTGGGVGENRFDARFKVLLLGNSGVGKTSILRCLMGETFNPTTISTIGIDLAKRIFLIEGHRVQLEIWDTAGQEQYYSIVALHFREARAFVVVYDVTDAKSFSEIRKYWLKSVDQYMDEPVPVFFAANKVDMSKHRQVSTEEGEQLTSQQCAHGFFETSAKTGTNVENLFYRVAESMVSTWGVPKRWYEMDFNGDADGRWPNQVMPRERIRLSEPVIEPGKRTCCKTK